MDFKVAPPGNQLSLVLHNSDYRGSLPHGAGITINSSLSISRQIESETTRNSGSGLRWNMHEFTILPDGRSALRLTERRFNAVYSDIGFKGTAVDQGFEEFDLETGETLFSWWAKDHISFSESYTVPNGSRTWDYL